MNEINSLVEYGTVGVCIALIILIGFLAKIVKNILCNHIEHNTRAIEENAKSNQELRSTVNELCIYLKGLNGKLKK